MNSEVAMSSSSGRSGNPEFPDGLFFHKISKSFGGTHALQGVSMRVGRGEIVALLGENGAGKSTLIKILGGIHQQDSGEVVIDRTPYRHTPSSSRVRQSVAFIHQDLGLIEWMSIAENMAMAQGYGKRAGFINWKHCENVTRDALKRVDCDFDPSMRISELTRADKSLVAIARALAVDCDYLVLDEPSASLPNEDVNRLFDVLKQLREDGVGMIYVSHRLDEIFQIADRVVVLRDGKMVGVRPVDHTSPEELVDMIVGKKPKIFSKIQLASQEVVMQLNDVRTSSAGPISLDIRKGEILGLVGLRGAGQEDIGRCLFGALEYEGQITLNGAPYAPASPKQAMQQGVGLIPRDRVVESIAASMMIRENFFLNPSASGRQPFQFQRRRTERAMALSAGEDVGLRPNNSELPIEALSGGNQQKVIVGRWLANSNRVLVAEDPTAGVDVGAKAEIYTLLSELVDSGVAVVIISTDFEEVATVTNRAIVFNRGKCTDELDGLELTTEALIQAASASEIISDNMDRTTL